MTKCSTPSAILTPEGHWLTDKGKLLGLLAMQEIALTRTHAALRQLMRQRQQS
jgi:hypothetical protein